MTSQPTTGHRVQSQHRRRQRIVSSAAALASRGGVDAMQMRTVAERAGVALGTLYRYFPSKMELVIAVVSQELDLLEAGIDRRPPTAATPAGRAVDLLVRATHGLMREPDLADALVRSLVTTNAGPGFGERITRMVLRVAATSRVTDDDPRTALAGALGMVWSMELLEILRGVTTVESMRHRLRVVADRLLTDF